MTDANTFLKHMTKNVQKQIYCIESYIRADQFIIGFILELYWCLLGEPFPETGIPSRTERKCWPEMNLSFNISKHTSINMMIYHIAKSVMFAQVIIYNK